MPMTMQPVGLPFLNSAPPPSPRPPQPFDGAPPPRVIDLVDTHSNFMETLTAPKMSYVQQLELAAPGGRLPPNSKPSLLQIKLKNGHNRCEEVWG